MNTIEEKAKAFLINKGYPIDANGVFPTYEEMYNIISKGLENQADLKTSGIWFNTKDTIAPSERDIVGWYKNDGKLDPSPKIVWFCSEEEARKEAEENNDCFLAYWAELPEQDFKKYYWFEKQGGQRKISHEEICKSYGISEIGEFSDGFHTFNELYYYRMLYNAAFFNMLPKEWVHKSKKHNDGEECFGGGWFIVMANLPTGQISNHYELKDWDLFQIPEKEKADKWDGHTPQVAAGRLLSFILEKQGEQKSADTKFELGQWIVWQGKCYKVNYNGCGYELVDQDGLSTTLEYDTVDESAHLWTIADAKSGDVLAMFYESKNYILIYRGLYEKSFKTIMSVFCFLEEGTYYDETDSFHIINQGEIITPATKEQRDLLFTKMRDAEYEWDAEKKELKELKKIVQNIAWNEEDETILEGIIDEIEANKNSAPSYDLPTYDKFLNWLKSLKKKIINE